MFRTIGVAIALAFLAFGPVAQAQSPATPATQDALSPEDLARRL